MIFVTNGAKIGIPVYLIQYETNFANECSTKRGFIFNANRLGHSVRSLLHVSALPDAENTVPSKSQLSDLHPTSPIT